MERLTFCQRLDYWRMIFHKSEVQDRWPAGALEGCKKWHAPR